MPKTSKKNSAAIEQYTKQELFELWRNFRDSPDELVLIMDFALIGKDEARQLIREFKGEPPEPEPLPNMPPFPPAPNIKPEF